MAYEMLLNTTITPSSAKKPNYTPAKTIKKAFKLVRKFFKQTKSKHQKFLNETIDIIDDDCLTSIEEYENLENERREAETAVNDAELNQAKQAKN